MTKHLRVFQSNILEGIGNTPLVKLSHFNKESQTEIFAKLESTGRGSGGEIQLTDGIAALMQDQDVYAMPFAGTRYDCGDKLGYLKANIDFALQRDDLGPGLREHLNSLNG